MPAPSPTNQFDVLVIGSGPGGYVAAIRAGQLGLKTAIVEKDPKFGGTCLHVGCIPTKALLQNADLYTHLRNGKEYGLSCDNLGVDWAAVLARKDKIVTKHAKGVEFLLKKNKVEMIRGYARLAGGGQLTVEQPGNSTRTLSARGIILATGSEARMLPGLKADPERVLTNREILNLKKIPKSMIIIGAGAVGVEFASIYKAFGTDVTLLEMLPRIVPLEDEEISAELEKSFRRQGITVHTRAKVEKAASSKAVTVEFSADGKTQKLEAETLLVAVGRKPNTEDIGLEKTRVQLERGYVKTDAFLQTAEPGLYAIGDIVAGSPLLAHVASVEGLTAVHHIAGQAGLETGAPNKDARPMRYDHVPNCTYCHPEVASVGLTEAQARERGHQVKIGKFPFAANSRASILGAHEGFVKIVADGKYGEVLGVHIIGPLATEMIAEATIALELEATAEEFMHTIHAHPTLAEAMFDAANGVYGLSIHV